MTLQFFMPMIPPTVTAQEHKVTVKNGKPIFYDPPQVKQAKMKLMAELAGHVPEKPFEGKPLRLVTKWIFPARGKRREARGKNERQEACAEWLIEKPDTDNLQKMLKDCMTLLCFWSDDCLVCSEIAEKFSGRPSGIYIEIRELEPIGGDGNDTERD